MSEILSRASFIATLRRHDSDDEEREQILLAHDAALRALVAQLAEALKQHENDACTCGPDPSAPSCVACYDRAALAAFRAAGIEVKP